MSRRLWVVVLALAMALVASRSQTAMPAEATGGAGENGPTSQLGWSSGWVPLTLNNDLNLTHDLGGDPSDYAVQLWFRDTGDGYGINTRAYGGIESNGEYYGALWKQLTNADVVLRRYGWDIYADDARIWLWLPEDPPDYCSPWTAMTAGGSQVFTHNLGGDTLDYVVGLWFSGPTAYGVNQQYFGGMEDGGENRGAWWHNLTASTVTVDRAANDSVAGEVRVCITVADPPSYDSGWVDIDAGATKTLTHNLGGRVDRYVVRMEFKDTAPSGLGVHLRDVGGNAIGTQWVGAAWQKLTNSSIGVYRYPDDARTNQVRVRIWERTFFVYLPCVMRN
jgi:hypothetical protein